ncbi:MAG TPA: anthranilate phosphoribosyltransferase, partial [Solirubrobacteraceae bacterium]|nr:anthranilate phosphoribosyltransferase [Solirubrobacteraceae bacterium]
MPHDLLTGAIDTLASGRDLSADEAGAVLDVIMAGDASETQIAAFLIALRTKGETVDELTGLARTMRDRATPVRATRGDLVDT